jgi:hypothetical protein
MKLKYTFFVKKLSKLACKTQIRYFFTCFDKKLTYILLFILLSFRVFVKG